MLTSEKHTARTRARVHAKRASRGPPPHHLLLGGPAANSNGDDPSDVGLGRGTPVLGFPCHKPISHLFALRDCPLRHAQGNVCRSTTGETSSFLCLPGRVYWDDYSFAGCYRLLLAHAPDRTHSTGTTKRRNPNGGWHSRFGILYHAQHITIDFVSLHCGETVREAQPSKRGTRTARDPTR